MRRFVKNFTRVVFSLQIGFLIVFIASVILLAINIKSCTDDVKKRGLKNILNETVGEYWEADSTESDSTK